MKPWQPFPFSPRKTHPVLLALTTVAALTLHTSCIGCRVDSSPTPQQRLEEALRREEARKRATALPKAASAVAPQCPLLNASAVPSAPPANAGHRVTLSWKASAPADPKHAVVVGYCIYRGAPGDPNPSLINSIPFKGTSCVDNLVANGQRYAYLVRAISAHGVTSIASNPAPADIPAVGRSNSPLSAPLCRGTAEAK